MLILSRVYLSSILCSSLIILYFIINTIINRLDYHDLSALPFEFDARQSIIGIRAIDRTPNYPYSDNQLLSYQNNVYLDKYRLHYCKIDKNMGSTTQALLCYIDNRREYEHFFYNQTWGPGLTNTACGASTENGELRRRFLAAAHDDRQFFSKV